MFVELLLHEGYEQDYRLLNDYLIEFELTFFTAYNSIQIQSFYNKYSSLIQIVMNVQDVNYRVAYLCYERISFYMEKLSLWPGK